MKINQFQALNIVRTYHKQLRVGGHVAAGTSGQRDTVNLSNEAKQKHMSNLAEAKPASTSQSPVHQPTARQDDPPTQQALPFE